VKRVLLLVLAAGLVGAASPPSSAARAAAFYDEIAKQRTDLGFTGGTFSGPGADVLAKAVENTQYVMIGEDHGIAEIPAFSTALCRENMTGDQKSNLDRTQLHRYHFVGADRAAFADTGKHPKVLVKMGGYHLFEGISMLGDRELGNFLAEYAALQGQRTLNILVLGAKGEQLAFAGMGHPYAPVPLDLLHDKRADFAFLAPFFKNLGSAPVLYDLRELRRPFARSGLQSVNLSHVIDGYDLLVVVPRPHASHQVS